MTTNEGDAVGHDDPRDAGQVTAGRQRTPSISIIVQAGEDVGLS